MLFWIRSVYDMFGTNGIIGPIEQWILDEDFPVLSTVIDVLPSLRAGK